MLSTLANNLTRLIISSPLILLNACTRLFGGFMIGLLMKDIYSLKKNILLTTAILFIYGGVMSMTSKDASFIVMYFMLMTSVSGISSFAYDDLAKWNAYSLTMPLTRKDIVQSKYILNILLTGMGFVFSLITILVTQFLYHTKGIQIYYFLFGGLCISLLINFIVTPVIFKIGAEKSRIVLFGIFGIPTILVVILSQSKLISLPDKATIDRILAALPYVAAVATLLLGYISYQISIKILQAKEF